MLVQHEVLCGPSPTAGLESKWLCVHESLWVVVMKAKRADGTKRGWILRHPSGASRLNVENVKKMEKEPSTLLPPEY